MMEVVKEILHLLGIETVEKMAINDSYTIEVEGFDDLAIEKVGPNQVSVAHHYVQRGDLMCDPEIVFHIDDGVWTPIRYTQHPHVHRHDPDGLELDEFLARWNENLRHQGFTDTSDDG